MFVMEQYNMSWEDALHLVQNRRYCISPNGGFLTQIKVQNGASTVEDPLVLPRYYIGIRIDIQSKRRTLETRRAESDGQRFPTETGR